VEANEAIRNKLEDSYAEYQCQQPENSMNREKRIAREMVALSKNRVSKRVELLESIEWWLDTTGSLLESLYASSRAGAGELSPR
jgi:hypothetical protein